MRKHIVYSLLLLLCIFHFTKIKAQEYCYDCNYDSLNNQLAAKQTDADKIKLLTLLIDLAPFDTFSVAHINQLITLNKEAESVNIAAYKTLRDAIIFYRNKELQKSLDAFKKAVDQFDSKKKIICLLLSDIRILYNNLNQPEERYKYYKEKLDYYLVNGPIENTAACYHGLGGYYVAKGNYNLSISNYLKAADEFKKFWWRFYVNEIGVCGAAYSIWGNFDKAVYYLNMALQLLKADDNVSKSYLLVALSTIKTKQHRFREAMIYANEAIEADTGINRNQAAALLQKCFIYLEQHQPVEAYPLLAKVKAIADSIGSQLNSNAGILELDYAFYTYSKEVHNYTSAATYLQQALQKAEQEGFTDLELKYLRELSNFYGEQNRLDLARKYTTSYFKLADTIQQRENTLKVAQYEGEQKELEQIQHINKLKQERAVQEATIHQRNLISWTALGALMLIAVSMIFLYRQLQVNKKTLHSLRETQSQLIQSEKMASLGELTAGIAHEIQNPLNFVNNFSEVSNELIDEMKDELSKGNYEEVNALANDIKNNQQKINHHGKRADAIVKGMLQHSRSSSGQKELTDINALADEYLRLSYHGLRAKDKSFNATMETHYDENIQKINIIPQDVGRVILNLFTNAFYAVSEKKKLLKDARLPGGQDYTPTVSVTTKKIKDAVEIIVRDNGNGIPKKVLDKIYQPFFTTKPTGEGTGLGLSLSYDIIKAHGGELKVETKEGEGAEFIIVLPLG